MKHYNHSRVKNSWTKLTLTTHEQSIDIRKTWLTQHDSKYRFYFGKPYNIDYTVWSKDAKVDVYFESEEDALYFKLTDSNFK